MDFTASRQKNLLSALESRGFDGLLVTSLANIAYLTGFHGSAGAVLVSRRGTVLWVDPRYTIQAREEASETVVHEARHGLLKAAAGSIKSKGLRRVGFEESNLSCRAMAEVRKAAGSGQRWIPSGGLVESLRAVKDSGEIESVRNACRLTAAAYEEVLPAVKPGVSELDLAAELEYKMKLKGAEKPAFDTIVASGARTALPHARPTSKLLEKGDLVIFDLGAILHGYCSDMTRTVHVGNPPARVRRLYKAVREAQQRGVEAATAGATAGSVDRAARTWLRRQSLARFFTHSTGHGVGLEIHESPRLGRGEKARLLSGTVVTVEPGIYMNGFGGIRIEDTVLVGPGGPETLTPASKDDWILD